MRRLSNPLVLALVAAFLAIAAGRTAAVTYIIEVQSGGTGTVTPSGVVEVPAGGSQTFTFTPTPSGCNGVVDVTVDDVSVGSGLTEYTFTNVQSDHVLYVSFGPQLTTTTTALDVRPLVGQCAVPETLTATVANADAGQVQFYNGAILLGTSTLTAGVATFIVTPGLISGPCSLSARYLGTSCSSPSTSPDVLYEVTDTGPQPWTLTLSVFSEPCGGGPCVPPDPFVLHGVFFAATTLQVGGAVAGSQMGEVTYYDGVTVLVNDIGADTFPMVSGRSSGVFEFLTLGVHVITAVAHPVQCVATVTSKPETLVVTDPIRYPTSLNLTISPIDAGGKVVLRAALSAGSDPRYASGPVHFLDHTVGVEVGRVQLVNGVASFTYGPVSGFARTIQAQYDGDGGYKESTSNQAILQTGQLPPPPPPVSLLSAPALYDTWPGPNSVASADFNAEGRPDLATANWNTKTVSVLLGNGDGTFGGHSDFGNGGYQPSMAVADLNTDGRPDLAVTSEAGVSVLLGNGDGTFGPETHFGTGCNSVAVGDLNADGRPDLVAASYFPNVVSVLLGNGDGTFGTKTDLYAGNGPWSVAIGDLNADGRPDLAVANYGDAVSPNPANHRDSSYVSILLGNGDGTFGPRSGFSCETDPSSIAIADLNSDGRLDLVTTNRGYYYVGWTVSVLLGNGDGTFGPKTDFIAGFCPMSVAIADLDADGRLDLAVGCYLDWVSVLLGRGDGTFEPRTSYGTRGTSVALADLNADGRPDLAVTGAGLATVQVLLNIGPPPPCAPVPVSFDFKPNILNLQSMGHWVTGTLEPEPPTSPGDIDIASIRLNGSVPVDSLAPVSIGDQDQDGRPDLTVKFDRRAVELTVTEGDSVPVTVAGGIGNGCFSETDVLRVIRGHVTAPSAGAVLQAGSTAEVRWDTPVGIQVQSVAVLSSSDDGATWNLVAQELPNTGSTLWIVPGAATDRARVAVVLVESADESGFEVTGVLGVSEPFVITAPLAVGGPSFELSLNGSVPNPTRDLTVSFTLPDAKPARLVVYDITGREVSRRAVDSMGAGRHMVTLGTSGTVAPGVYLVHLIRGDRRLVARMVVVR